MKILYVTSEANPYAASGGLGDVLGALPIAVAENPEVTAEVILPLYGSMAEKYRLQMEKVCDLSFRLSWRSTGASVFRIRNGNVNYYFVENHFYFSRPRLYGEFDDGERFAFFSAAVVEFMRQTGNIPDILHCNDWQTALAVIYLKTSYAHLPEFSRVRTIYTIHNIEYQGKFDPYILGDVFGLDSSYYHVVEYDGCINLMKGAITVSDYVTTVSPNYACELRYDFFAFGLAGVIAQAAGKMCGIINGIDYRYFSPETGGDIYAPYNTKNMKEGKRNNKLRFQEEVGLPADADTPLLVMISRLASQKGIDLLTRILDELLCDRVQVVVLGTGEPEYEAALRNIDARHGNLRALIKFDRVTSKKMYAAADMLLMPSKSEPCGLSQMIACSYGTVPIVRKVGGLYDSIRPYGEENSNGFCFDNYNAHELLATIRYALSVYRDPAEWHALTLRAKKSDFSWERSANAYLTLYRNILK